MCWGSWYWFYYTVVSVSFVYGVDSVCVCVNPLCVCLSLGWPAPLCRCTWSTCWTPSSTPTLRCDWRPYRWWCLFYSRDWCTLCRSVSYNTHPTELVDIYVSALKEYICTCNCTTRLVQTLCQYPVNTRINKLVPNICHVQTFTCVH